MNRADIMQLMTLAQIKSVMKSAMIRFKNLTQIKLSYSLNFYHAKIIDMESNEVIYKEPLPLMLLSIIIGKKCDTLYQYVRRKDKYTDVITAPDGRKYNIVVGLPTIYSDEIPMADFKKLLEIFFTGEDNAD